VVFISKDAADDGLHGRVDQLLNQSIASAWEGSIIDRFDAIARRFASRLAIQDAAASITYAELMTLLAGLPLPRSRRRKDASGCHAWRPCRRPSIRRAGCRLPG
jgi:hypothetical protein